MFAERSRKVSATEACTVLSRHSVPIIINGDLSEDPFKTILATISFCNDKGHTQKPKVWQRLFSFLKT